MGRDPLILVTQIGGGGAIMDTRKLGQQNQMGDWEPAGRLKPAGAIGLWLGTEVWVKRIHDASMVN
jgi:hypothetical protein